MPKLPRLILLVEDEPSIRDIISDVVDNAGYRIEVAGNFADGGCVVEILAAGHADYQRGAA